MTNLTKQRGSVDAILMGIVAVLIGGTVWYVHGVKVDRDRAKADLAVQTENKLKAEGVVKEQKASIDKLSELRRIDAETMATLALNNTATIQQFTKRKQDRNDLENSNVEVKTYLQQPVPVDLRRLLDKSNSAYFGANQNPTGLSTGRPVEGHAEASR